MGISDSHGSGVLEYDTPYFIAGGNRAGRPPELKTQILDGLISSFCEIAGVGRNEVSGSHPRGPGIVGDGGWGNPARARGREPGMVSGQRRRRLAEPAPLRSRL